MKYHHTVQFFDSQKGYCNSLSRLHKAKALANSEADIIDDSLFYTVVIEQLDSILRGDKIHIKMAKMDAQGFECNVLEGMGAELASTIDVLKFEYQEKFLHPHGCRDIIGKVQDFGFSVYQHFEAGAMEPFQKHLGRNQRPQFRFAEGELFAVRDRKG